MFTRIMSRYNPYNNEVEDIYFWVSSSGLKSSSVFSNICNVSYGRIWVVDCEASTWLTAIKASTFKIARVKWRFVGSSRSGHMHNERKYEASWNFYSFERKRKIGLNQQHHLMGSTGDGRCGLTLLSEHGNQLKELGIYTTVQERKKTTRKQFKQYFNLLKHFMHIQIEIQHSLVYCQIWRSPDRIN